MNTIHKSWLVGITLVLTGELTLSLCMPEGLQTRNAIERMEQQLTLEPPDIQIMGASAAAGGIDTSVLAGSLVGFDGMTIGNYALAGTSALYLEPQLRRLLDTGRKPGIILFAPHPANLRSGDPDRFLGRFASPDEVVQFANASFSPAALFLGLGARYSYSMRYREELRDLFSQGNLEFLRTARRPVAPQPEPVRILARPMPPGQELNIDSDVRFSALPPAVRAPFSVCPLVDASLHRFFSLAHDEGIRVVWIFFPLCHSVAALPNAQADQENYRNYVEKMTNAHNLFVPCWDVPTYPDAYFLDPWHLNRRGARRYSEHVAGLLSRSGTASPRANLKTSPTLAIKTAQ